MGFADENKGREKRRHERLALKNALKVFGSDCESFIGWLLNITEAGMQLESEEPIAMLSDIEICVEIVTMDVTLMVRSLWSSYDEDMEVYRTGFRFLEMSPETRQNIRSLIDALKVTF